MARGNDAGDSPGNLGGRGGRKAGDRLPGTAGKRFLWSWDSPTWRKRFKGPWRVFLVFSYVGIAERF